MNEETEERKIAYRVTVVFEASSYGITLFEDVISFSALVSAVDETEAAITTKRLTGLYLDMLRTAGILGGGTLPTRRVEIKAGFGRSERWT